jgi:hypothetical protein
MISSQPKRLGGADIYYRLKPEVYLINGSNQSILSNVLTGGIIALDNNETKTIIAVENNKPHSGSPTVEELIKIGWMDKVDSPVFVDKIRFTNAFNKKRFWKSFPQITTVMIQITSGCGNKCGNKRCMSCFCPMCLASDEIDEMSYINLRKIIDSLKKYEPLVFILTGGNPLSHKEFDKIYNYVKATGIQTHVSLCSVDFLDNAKKDIPIILTISNETDLIKYLQKNENREKIDVYVNSKICLDVRSKRYSDPPFVSKEDFEKRSTIGHFFTRIGFDSCLCGKVTVLSNGDVIPCFGMHNKKLGNFFKEDVSTVLRKLYEECWSIGVDEWGNDCVGCAYRYNCISCRKYSRSNCMYDMEKGVWK